MTATPAARRLLDTLAKPHATLTGERRTENDGISYILRESDTHGEILRTTFLPNTLVSGMITQKLLTAKESRKVGLALYLIYTIPTGRQR